MTSTYTHLLQGVQTRRQMLKISAVDAAKALGMERASYYRLERGERRVYLDKALTLARLLGCTVYELAQEPTIEEQVEAFKRAKMIEQHDAYAEEEAQREHDEWHNAVDPDGSLHARRGSVVATQVPATPTIDQLPTKLPDDVAELFRSAEEDEQ